MDELFGQVVVKPLQAVFYLDLWFWDSDASSSHAKLLLTKIVDREDCRAKLIQLVQDHSSRDASAAERFVAALPLPLTPEFVPKADAERLSKLFEEEGYSSEYKYDTVTTPLMVVWLVVGATTLTLRMRFINVRAFWHALQVIVGKFDSEGDAGEVSHFQALSSALSGTVGIGNIAGVAIAVHMGGPGVLFWMTLCGLLGMTSKFTECTLAQLYRQIDDEGNVTGGPMIYLKKFFEEKQRPRLAAVLSNVFACMCLPATIGCSMFQANQATEVLGEASSFFTEFPWVYGLFQAVMVGIIIIGGVKRIATVASYLVPGMCCLYLLMSLVVLCANIGKVPEAIGTIFASAFSTNAVAGGCLGVLALGFQRASFSNEAGLGSAAIVHAAAATEEPVREGIVALLEPFIDTCVICNITGMTLVCSGLYKDETLNGVRMTAAAFGSVSKIFPVVLSFIGAMFGFSTIISWSYYGAQCSNYLLGPRAVVVFKVALCIFVFIGSTISLGTVLELADIFMLGLSFPNMLGLIPMSGLVAEEMDKYMDRLAAGAFHDVKRLDESEEPGNPKSQEVEKTASSTDHHDIGTSATVVGKVDPANAI